MNIRPISSTAVSLYPQTIYFIAMVFGVMTFGILSDIVGRKKVTHIFTFLGQRPLPSFFIIYIFFQGFDTFDGVYEHFWNDNFLHAKLEKINDMNLMPFSFSQICSKHWSPVHKHSLEYQISIYD